MNINERIPLIIKIAETVPNIGKTAIMKCMYILQTIKKLPLGYHFEIYTYGPYSSVIMDEIDYSRQCGYINVDSIIYSNGKFGYQINCSELGKQIVDKSSVVLNFDDEINEILSEFGNKKASDLELFSTILFVINDYKISDKKEIVDLVQKIKPKFSYEYIIEKYNFLSEKQYIPD